MKKLRLYFVFFFILLALPIAILLRHTYGNLEQESFFFYRKTTEGLMATVHQRLEENLADEEQRPYTHYRYVHVAERPVPQQEGLNLSPLADFPVESDIPGILGYYQIDPDGSFHTPLLPEETTAGGMVVPLKKEREQVRDQLAGLLKDQPFFPPSGLRSQREEPQQKKSNESVKERFADLRKNIESSADASLERKYYREASQPKVSMGLSEEEDRAESSSYLKRQVQKASPQQAKVFDSKLKDVYSADLDQLEAQSASPQPSDSPRYRAAGRQESGALEVGDETGYRNDDIRSEPEVVVEVDPFQTQLIDGEWLAFYRKVWARERRYTQGFIARLPELIEAQMRPALMNSALPGTASYLLFYQGQPMPSAALEATTEKPLLLYGSTLPHPLSDFHLAVTVDKLPRSPGHRIVNFLALFLSLLFVGGFFGIYRLTATQMELSQKKSDFVSAVSHELKTPLTAIRMYGEMLMEDWVKEEKKQRYYQHIHDESERLSRLIQNVLTLAELERNEWEMNLTACNPVKFVSSVLDRLSNQVRGAGFQIETVVEGDPKPIQADSDALTQILINLIDNAIKFSKEVESKKIVLTVSQVGTDCYIRVRDFGPGIPRRKLKRIFEKFYRIDDEMTRTTRGTGIGLSLVKMLADAMKVRVDVTNRRPGAEFSVRFSTASK